MTMRCMCGDTQCPSCGCAQGTIETDKRSASFVRQDEIDARTELREMAEAYEYALERLLCPVPTTAHHYGGRAWHNRSKFAREYAIKRGYWDKVPE